MSDGSEQKVKRPASQYYWGDWFKDLALQACSLPARGLWHEMNCLMHQGEPYGHLTMPNGKPMEPAQLANLCKVSPALCRKLIAELEGNGVFSRSDTGAIYSRRMVRDEDLRNRRASGGAAGAEHGIKGAEHGSKGGKPTHGKGGLDTPLGASSKPPPSSSSSSSASAIPLSLPAESPPPPDGDREPGIDLLGHQLNGHAPKTVPDCPHGEILALWAEVMPELPQHDPAMWPESARADHLRARWRSTAALKGWVSKDDGLRYFRKLFGWCRRSDFLMGKTQSRDRRPFEFELAWLVNATNWTKVHEGKFHG